MQLLRKQSISVSGIFHPLMHQPGKMIFLFQNDDEAQRFNFSEFDKLPNTVVWGTDVEGKIKQEVWQQMKLTTPSLPVFLICDSFNRVVFVQQGYTINLGEQLIKVIRQL